MKDGGRVGLRGGSAVIADRFIGPSLFTFAALAFAISWDWGGFPNWFGVFRAVMIALGGLVVIAIVLIVAVAVISGVMGMIGNLRKRRK
jgi:hypothetical protein